MRNSKISEALSRKEALLEKECKTCQKIKLVSEFQKASNKTRLGFPVYRGSCKSCESTRRKKQWAEMPEDERKREAKSKRRWQETNKWYIKDYRLRTRFGITLGDFNRKLEAQQCRCAICSGDISKTACVDHCHNTGRVRDLLCSRCNVTIGAVGESVSILKGMIGYIEKHAGISARTS